MELPHVYTLPEKRLFPSPCRLKAVGWMPHHIYIHRDTHLPDCFVCITSNSESDSECRIGGRLERTAAGRGPLMNLLLPGTVLDTIRASYHDELFFIYPPECAETLRKFPFRDEPLPFSFTPALEAIIAQIHLELPNLEIPGVSDRLDQLAFRLISEIFLQGMQSVREDAASRMKIHSIAAELLRGKPLPALLKNSGFSMRTFYREWEKVFPVPPNRYCLEHRLEYACALLTGSALPPGEIARRCGFSTTVCFYQQFRKRYHMAPLAFRRSGRTRIFPYGAGAE